MKNLVLLLLFFFTQNSFGAADCVVSNGNRKFKLRIKRDFISIKNLDNGVKREFRDVSHSWDGHGAGMLIGKTDGVREDFLISIRYDNHFGITKNVIVLTGSAYDEHRPGHYREFKAKECKGQF